MKSKVDGSCGFEANCNDQGWHSFSDAVDV